MIDHPRFRSHRCCGCSDSDRQERFNLAISGGEDFELLFTAPAAHRAAPARTGWIRISPSRRIGVIGRTPIIRPGYLSRFVETVRSVRFQSAVTTISAPSSNTSAR
jgi:hypothetical protein